MEMNNILPSILKNRTFVIIDDKLFERNEIASLLNSKGAQVKIFKNKKEATKLLERCEDLIFIILDTHVSKLHGYTFVLEVCEEQERIDGMIVFFDKEEDPNLRLGMSDHFIEKLCKPIRFIAKPYDINTFWGELEDMISSF